MSRANCTDAAGGTGNVQPIAQRPSDEEPADPAVAVGERVKPVAPSADVFRFEVGVTHEPPVPPPEGVRAERPALAQCVVEGGQVVRHRARATTETRQTNSDRNLAAAAPAR